MKLSMWMIAEKLKKYSPTLDIRRGDACITGVRVITGNEQGAPEPQYVYLDVGHNSESNVVYTAVLSNGEDRLVIDTGDINEIFNDLLAVFDFYNAWESALWEASAHKSFQEIIDLGNAALENPMMIADRDGNVLAMSSAYVDEDINSSWIESRVSGHVPLTVLGAPMQTPEGEKAIWSDTPQIYIMPDGTRTIGSFLSVNGDLIAGFGLWEYKRPIITSDVYLIKILCDVLCSTLEAQKRSVSMRSRANIIADLLSGTVIDSELIHTLKMSCKRPWRLIMIDNPFSDNVIFRRNLIHRLMTSERPCVPLLYDEYVLALASESDAEAILNEALSKGDRQYCVVCLSLPFDDLLMVSIRYQQMYSILGQIEGKPGLYYGEKYALRSLLRLTREQAERHGLIHPALNKLKRCDEQKQSELYETLYQYLLHERSVQMGAEAMHVHKNTFLYRIQKIRELLGVNLDEPETRAYLLLSYLAEKA